MFAAHVASVGTINAVLGRRGPRVDSQVQLTQTFNRLAQNIKPGDYLVITQDYNQDEFSLLAAYTNPDLANYVLSTLHRVKRDLPTTGLRFFTVYGPWGRPDMAPMLFARAILAGNPIKVFNYGKMKRDFTYIDDIVEGVLRCCSKPATVDVDFDPLQPDPATAAAPHRVFNIGNSQPIELLRFIAVMEQALGREAIKDFQPMQPGDVVATAADTQALEDWIGFKPSTSIEIGAQRFAAWYKDYYRY